MTEAPSFHDVRERLVAKPGDGFLLKDRPTVGDALFGSEDLALASVAEDAAAIGELQDRLYAEGQRAVLLILQGMDTAGKSSTTKAVFAETSPIGVRVSAFGPPSEEERDRDFLWRVHKEVPKKGFIGIFDRSHYEDVLIGRVRELAPADEIEKRYEQINAFEELLSENGVTIVKCMLNISREKQGQRLRERLEKPHKRWKFSPGDLDDRQLWDEFMEAYETAVRRCSTDHAPWYIVPSDSKPERNALVARLLRGTLEEMGPKAPDPGYRPDDFEIG